MAYRITKTTLTKTAVFIPVPVRRIWQMMPPLPQFDDVPPRLPRTGEPQLFETKLILAQTTGLLVLVILLVKLNPLLSMMVLIVGLVAIVVLAQYQRQGYQRRRLAYGQQMEAYFRELEAYSRREGQNQREITQRHSPERVWRFRQHQLAQLWQDSPPQAPQYLDPGTPLSSKSSAELPETLAWLQSLLPNAGTWIYRPRLGLTGFAQGYTPDFLYVAEATGGLPSGAVVLVEVMENQTATAPDGNATKIPAADRSLLQEAVLRQGWFLVYLSADGHDWDHAEALLGDIFQPPAVTVTESTGA